MSPGVLIIDDEESVRFTLKRLLTKMGIETCCANSGVLGLEAALDKRPELIFLDIKMPGMGGFEVLGKLKSNPFTSGIPVVFITGYIDDTDMEKAAALGAETIISKPMRMNDIVPELRKHLYSAGLAGGS